MGQRRNRSGSHANHHIVFLYLCGQTFSQLSIARHGLGMAVALVTQARRQRVGMDAVNRLLPGLINRQHQNTVCAVHAGAKIVEQIAQARITMRLHDCNHPPVRNAARAFQHGGDFDRMMRIIIKQANITRHMRHLAEASFDA